MRQPELEAGRNGEELVGSVMRAAQGAMGVGQFACFPPACIGRDRHNSGTDLFKKLFPASSLVASGLPAFQRQETIFVTLDLSLLSILLVCHALLSKYWGNPSTLLVLVLGIGFSLRSAEFIWVHSLSEMPSRRAIVRLTWLSIYLDFALGVILSILTNSEDPPYYILFVVPVLL